MQILNKAKRQTNRKKKKEKNRPPGKDTEEKYLERAVKNKLQKKTEKIDASHEKYICPECKYTFKYDFEKQTDHSHIVEEQDHTSKLVK